MEEYMKYWKNYINFSTRSTRKEFWLPVLFNFVISGILAAISSKLGTIFSLAVLIPNLSNAVRRMHDINKSGWYLLLGLIPIVGWIIVLVYECTATVEEGNAYPVDADVEDVDDEVIVENNNNVVVNNNDNTDEKSE